jgi:hypothetical protein
VVLLTCAELQEQVESAVAQANAAALRVGAALRQFEARVGAGAASRRGDARSRIARLQYAAARHRYATALAGLHRALHALRDDRLQLLHHQIKLSNYPTHSLTILCLPLQLGPAHTLFMQR